ncbi:polysaccharide pyruvyl transferase family protein [Clostridium algoriphilum]|uniref:polysaccharide pyruvyl transferase family protein n=1 Tax=Clostridium algoriphilum TaxID=198347 RepID=UPI001CF2305A|nr:polysaccharide pyruvyl transferase family protein [Clostridium algoriphilum]MCB2295316.1 polysaccharide pyruvyl transferase family protein [Clostridium algoriphilum]
MKKILIANAVPTNNGDAALVFGLSKKLIDMGYEVIFSTLKCKTMKKLYPDMTWVKSEYDFNRIEHKLCSIFPKLKENLLKWKIVNNKFYKDVDIVISAPGGYINSYYGIYDRLYCMDLIKKIHNVKLVMYSQSVGPLSVIDEKILDNFMNDFDLFMVRDEDSYEKVKQYNNVIRTNDAAFLLDKIECNNEQSNIVAISVRDWGHDGRSKENYMDLIKNIVYKCVDNGNKVEFVSTCQGSDNYIDDSIIAKEIQGNLQEKYKSHVEVNCNHYLLNDLREYIGKFKFVIGTRLHMCILAIMSGVPAFNISYEVKGKECYKILGLSEYSIDYNGDINKSLDSLQEFIDDNKGLKEIYDQKAKEMNKAANGYFENMINKIIKGL